MSRTQPLPMSLNKVQQQIVALLQEAQRKGFLITEVRANWTHCNVLGLVEVLGEKTPAVGR